MIDELIEVKPYNNISLLLTFTSCEQRILDINRLFNIQHHHLSETIKMRWKIMYDQGEFFKYEIMNGDLVFGGWVEIFRDDLKDLTIPIEVYRLSEKEKKLFVHYGSQHYDKNKFVLAKNEKQWMKPVGGLWGSPVGSQYSWKKWCEDNDFSFYAENECFFFRLACPQNWSIVHSRKEWEKYPKQSPLLGLGHAAIDYELITNKGIGDGLPNYAIVTEFEDREEFDFCFWGYDCDSVLVLDDSILIENYDAKFTNNPITLLDLLPLKPFKVIRDKVQVSCLLRSPDEKFYIYYEEPSVHYGFKTLVACVSDERIVEVCGYSENEARDLIEEMKNFKEEIEIMIKENQVLLVR